VTSKPPTALSARRRIMAKAKRDLLEVLRLELEFLRNGGYRQASSWRPKFIFED
jgi:hypothetical protein